MFRQLVRGQRVRWQGPIVKDQQRGQGIEVERLFDRMRVGLRVLQPPGHPRVHRLATRSVVVVLGVESYGSDAIPSAKERIEPSHLRKFDLHRLVRPVAGRGHHQERSRGDRGGDLHVVRVETQTRKVFAETAPLHVQ